MVGGYGHRWTLWAMAELYGQGRPRLVLTSCLLWEQGSEHCYLRRSQGTDSQNPSSKPCVFMLRPPSLAMPCTEPEDIFPQMMLVCKLHIKPLVHKLTLSNLMPSLPLITQAFVYPTSFHYTNTLDHVISSKGLPISVLDLFIVTWMTLHVPGL